MKTKTRGKFPHYHIKRRKQKSKKLSGFKKSVNDFNEKYFKWLEDFTEFSIIMSVVILILIIIVKESKTIYDFLLKINIQWGFLMSFDKFQTLHMKELDIIEGMIICLFVIDLYFQFFKRASTKEFLKTYFIDLIAIMPFSWIFSEVRTIAGIERTQEAAHAALGGAKVAETTATLAKEEAEYARIAKMSKIEEFFTRITRLLRTSMARHYKKKKKQKK